MPNYNDDFDKRLREIFQPEIVLNNTNVKFISFSYSIFIAMHYDIFYSLIPFDSLFSDKKIIVFNRLSLAYFHTFSGKEDYALLRCYGEKDNNNFR